MRRLPVLLTLGLLVTLLSTELASPGLRPAEGASSSSPSGASSSSTVTLRLTPSRVTVFEGGTVEPTGLLAEVRPAARGRTVTFQQRVGSTWRSLARVSTDATGRAFRPLRVTAAGTTAYRAVVSGTQRYRSAASSTRSLAANSNRDCRPTTAPVTSGAAGEVYCLLQRLDTWRRDGLMGVGQQLNVSNTDFLAPLQGIRPVVVGFDLNELARGETYDFPRPPLRELLRLAHEGAVLSATWHAPDPFRGSPPDLRVLLSPTPGDAEEDAVYHRFWDDLDAKLALLRRLETGDGDSDLRTAVVLRLFHEVNGDFFWWGQPDPTAYRDLWQAVQQRAESAGVRNVVWAYSGNRHTSSTHDPARYVPRRVDLGGLDTYDPEQPSHGLSNAEDVLPLEGYAAVARVARVPRMALTEVGPHGSADGRWNPAVITSTVRRAAITPLWAMLWFDDTGYPQAGRKQLISLHGGRTWLASCPLSLCPVR